MKLKLKRILQNLLIDAVGAAFIVGAIFLVCYVIGGIMRVLGLG